MDNKRRQEKRGTHILKITGKGQVNSFINKNSTLKECKDLASSLADLMKEPKTLSIWYSSGMEDVQVYEYIKRI